MFPFRGTLRGPLAASYFCVGALRGCRSGGERPAKSEWQERVVSGGCHARVVLVVVLAVLLPSLLPLLLLVGGWL